MTSTRISNDKLRIYKNLQQSTDVGKHVLNVPGNGLDIPFINDPHVRMQLWGANHANDIITIENSLKGIDRQLSRDCSEYTKPSTKTMKYSNNSFNIMNSFISQPAWELRDKESLRELGYPENKNEHHIFIPFNNNLGTRMFEKDIFCRN
jgi:hypothetical protein